ncbi:tachylectin-related carbohydrate-binding protein [Streptomyces globisporus]|uniref:tachylectin-related carbohydrate-binding protein n=1 Tax=Streptomyces globisporus TaxID=1908 RepID=UPI0004C622A3|nr:tachylectin-related carbohydrate-binding protein [Streptomyces globisporus]
MRAGLVLATALVAGIAPVALGGAAAMAAPAVNRAEAAVEPGTVVQEGGRTKVWAGEEGPGTIRFRANLPAGVTGPVTATLGFAKPVSEWPGAGVTSERLATGMGRMTTWSVDGSAPAPLTWHVTGDEAGEPIAADVPAVEAKAALNYAVTLDLSSADRWFGSLDLAVTLKDAQGNVVSKGAVGVDAALGTPEAPLRGAVHARDKDGVLWRYEATGSADGRLTARKRVGGGWGAYTAIVPLDRATAAGHGDLVARDKDGVLWYYEGSGDPDAPFKPRVRVGGGWNTYTSIAGYGFGHLVARDKDGVLWNYVPGAGSRFWPRVRVGGGWNAYTRISGYAGGLVARDAAGVLWKYNPRTVAPSSSKPFDARSKVGGGWNVYNTLAGTQDLGRWNNLDLLARTATGDLYAYRGKPSGFGWVPTTRTKVGHGWNIYNIVL